MILMTASEIGSVIVSMFQMRKVDTERLGDCRVTQLVQGRAETAAGRPALVPV